MKHAVKIGQQDYTVLVFIPDPASTDGSGKTGLNAAALTVSYVRVETDNDVAITDATASLNDLSALTDAHADWGLDEVSSTLAPGLYRLDIADAVFATGAWSAVVYVQITSSAAAASPMEFVLTTEAPYSRVVPPTVAEFEARTLVAADYATAAELAKVPKSDSTVTWNATALASINAEVDTALNTAIPGSPTADSINQRVAAIDALTEASGTGDLAAIKTTIGVAGAGLTALATQASVNDLPTVAEMEARTLVAANYATATAVADVPTVAEMEARTLVAANYATAVALTTINGYLDTEIAAILAAVDTEVAAIKAVTDQLTAAQGEPSGVPAANASPLAKLAWIALLARNKLTQTATTQTAYADNGTTPVAAATVADDGTTATRGEWA